MHVDIRVGDEQPQSFNNLEIWVLADQYLPFLKEPPLFHDTFRLHNVAWTEVQAFLPQMRNAIAKMEDQGYHLLPSPPTRQLGETPPPRWLYDTLVRLTGCFARAVQQRVSIEIR